MSMTFSLRQTLRRWLGAGSPQRPRSVRPCVELLEDRAVPTTTIFEAAGSNAAAIQTTVDNFRNALGTFNGNNGGTFPTGRREINWDGVPANAAAPNLLPPDFFNQNLPGRGRGAVFANQSGNGFQVSTNPAVNAAQVRFGNINSGYVNAFGTFSTPLLFSPVGSNVTEVSFFVPGTQTRATTRAFGAVFTDVDLPTSSRIEFYDTSNGLLFTKHVLPSGGTQGLSFLGVVFDSAVVGKVRIISGNTPLGPDDLGATDVVALDDFIYGEPVATQSNFHVLGAVGIGAGVQSGPQVQIYDVTTNQVLFNLTPFPGFAGGARVALGDVNADGISDVVVGAGPGGGPQVRVFDGRTGQPFAGTLGSFFALPSGFTGGLYVASADVNGDSFYDVIVGADAGGGPQVSIFSGKDGSSLGSFFALPSLFTGGVRVAGSDLNSDGFADIIVGAGPGGGPQVTIFNGRNFATLNSFFATVATFTGGVYVAVGDVEDNGTREIVVGTGTGTFAQVFVFDSTTLRLLKSFAPFGTFTGGVTVAVNDREGDGIVTILTGAGPGGGPQLSTFNGETLVLRTVAFPFATTFTGGIFVASRS